MRFMFFGPEVCLGLPSDSASPRTPLPPTTATAAFTAQDLHLVDNAHAGHTKKSFSLLREKLSFLMVRRGRLELPQPCGHKVLSLARLPVPPPPRNDGYYNRPSRESQETGEKKTKILFFP